MVVIDMDEHYVGTDEVTVEFYECPICGFERVPALQEHQFAKDHGPEPEKGTAKYCPGCGQEIIWESNQHE